MAYEFYVTVEGTKQGKIKGDSTRESHKASIPCFGFTYEVTSPRDLASGQASGKRQHKPITVQSEWGASTPQLWQALVTNEVLKSVLIEFMKTTPEGVEEVYSTIKLTNATVSNAKFLGGTERGTHQHESTTSAHELVDWSFTFSKIEFENKAGKTAAADEWAHK
jgi:type VI secretion system secreted protein Hcp